MDEQIKKLEQLAEGIAHEKNIDAALDQFIAGAQLVKDILRQLETKQGQVTVVVDDVEKLLEE